MVKNSIGGKNAKGLARKLLNQPVSDYLQVSTDELEQYACVTKVLGNGMCEIYTNNNVRLIGHIRNKMKGRNIRNNRVTLSSIVLVGLREWESIPKNCDILCVYDDRELDRLSSMPNVDIRHVMQLRNNSATFSNNSKNSAGGSSAAAAQNDKLDEITFTNDIYDNTTLLTKPNSVNVDTFVMDTGETVNIDDI
jgi:translation initiation factor IF-1